MYNHESLPSIVMRFGAKPPHERADFICEQANLAHKYRNLLVEIELHRRERVEQAVKSHDPILPALETEIEKVSNELAELRAVIRRKNTDRGKRTAEPEDRDRAGQLRAALKSLRAERKDRRTAAFADGTLRAGLDAIDKQADDDNKKARAGSGLYWGTYLVVENSMKSARKGAPPRFKRRDGSTHLAVQLQGGLGIDSVFSGEDRRIWIEHRSGETGWTMAHLRVGSDGRDPIWASLRVKIHRPLPRDCSLKWAHLLCTPIGPRREWSLQLVLSRESGWVKPDLAATGEVGVDLGWRVLPNGDGLRVAYAVGSNGREEQLVLPMEDVGRWRKADDLRSIRDLHFNRCRDLLADWLAAQPDLPDWLRERTSSIRQWRSPARLAALCLAWRDQRFNGDVWVFHDLCWGDAGKHAPGLEQWRRHDKHLWTWEASQRAKAVNWRRDLYRNFVARLSRRYATAHIEAINWTDIAAHLHAEESQDDTAARLYRHIAAPGTLAQMITERFAHTVRVDPAYTTLTCHRCGSRENFDAAKYLQHKCESCGAVWDQDQCAAVNLLASGPVVTETADPLEV